MPIPGDELPGMLKNMTKQEEVRRVIESYYNLQRAEEGMEAPANLQKEEDTQSEE